MNMYAYQQKALVGCCVGVGETEISVSNGVVCPKPPRTHQTYQLLQFRNQEMEACDLKAGTELLDIILTKVLSWEHSPYEAM
ncbi:hypothetical protein RND71_005317 [Anisodus tanguticus]|uniref:Uncharacterized protein n=1 Tax=Anisodus tanguticus TaxID=243964 RepID=A0AAE1SR97_9SOLA|nr:hypothetical protein RND71_005317 [Anisodus tanguticus]